PLSKFMETIDRTSQFKALIRFCRESGKLLFRKAGLLIGEGQIALGTLNLVGAFLCNPQFVSKRLFALRKSS
ncbi:MAG: hypothetical protein F6K28_25960, partial [Microcoleus sp. SIO2G3]|nr:hypothetical protein [Microcoleus sp. SIO2G3]